MKSITCYREFTENIKDESIEDGIGFVIPEKETILNYFNKYSTKYTAVTCGATDYIKKHQ